MIQNNLFTTLNYFVTAENLIKKSIVTWVIMLVDFSQRLLTPYIREDRIALITQESNNWILLSIWLWDAKSTEHYVLKYITRTALGILQRDPQWLQSDWQSRGVSHHRLVPFEFAKWQWMTSLWEMLPNQSGSEVSRVRSSKMQAAVLQSTLLSVSPKKSVFFMLHTFTCMRIWRMC